MVRYVTLAAFSAALITAPVAGRTDPVPPLLLKGAVTIRADMGRPFRLPEGTRRIVVGNASVADATPPRDNSTTVLTGKSYGTTNIIMLDADGSVLAEASVSVTAQRGLVTVQKGKDRSSFACAPRCAPSAQLGDSSDHFSTLSGQMQTRATAGSQ